MQECKSDSSESERWRSALTGLCTCDVYRRQHVSLCGGGGGGSLMMFPAPLLRRWASRWLSVALRSELLEAAEPVGRFP